MRRFISALVLSLMTTVPAGADQPFAAILGARGVPDEISRLPQLPLALAFNRDGTEIIARQENGAVMGWSLTSGESRLIAQTDGAFAYCAALDRMVIATGKTAVLLSLSDGGYTNLSDGIYDHAAFSDDCKTLALAEADTSAVEVWTLTETPRLKTVATFEHVRNGIALSGDGTKLAAATGSYLEDAGHRTAVELFRLDDQGTIRTSALALKDQVVGMWTMAFTPRGALVLGTQREKQSGLMAIAAADGEVWWSWDGFPSYWVRAIAASPDGLWALSGDEKGSLRLWDAASGERAAGFPVGQPIQTATFSADGTLAAIALWDGTIAVLRVPAFVSRFP